MRRVLLLAGICLFLVAAWADTGSAIKTLDKPFAAGGTVDMDLESGNYTIKPSDVNHVMVRWEDRDGVEVRIDTNGNNAKLRVVRTPHNNFQAEIEVPRNSDLRVRLTAGNLDIGSIRGNKDIESHAGNVQITVGDPQDYRRVDASLWAGNIVANPFESNKSGLFRSMDWHGNGQYRLHAQLLAGNLTLRGGQRD